MVEPGASRGVVEEQGVAQGVPEAATRADDGRQPGLAVHNLEVVYSDVILVLRGISIEVPDGDIVAVLGANGAGKTTLLRAISGLLGVHRGEITKGEIRLGGRSIDGLDPAAIVRSGLAQVMEGRRTFAELTVEENLRAGSFARPRSANLEDSYARVFALFPRLEERRRATAGYLSGGEQQMLAIGRALMAAPRLLVLDEPSLGLAPTLVRQIAEIIVEINRQGTSVLLVEQNANMALEIAGRGYVLESGRVVLEGTAEELRADRDVQEFYLGMGEGAGVSFRDVKTYRRRKGWSA
jgi:branched-chain amino acid transport system ATP-binding protein